VCAQDEELIQDLGKKLVGVGRQTANQHNIMISLKFHHSLKREFLQEQPNSMLLGSLYARFQSS
jgi:hypothetical protein